MYVATVPNRSSPPAILLRESYRENGKVLNRTLANLSDWPAEKVQSLRAVLRGDRLLPAGEGGFEIRRSLPHGHVVAALATARQIGLDDLLPRRGSRRHRALAFGLIIARLLDPAAKLATARMLDTATASHSLGEVLDLGSVTARELYATLDWLVSEQAFIETALARRHLKEGMLVLYDVTSTYLEGRCCPLAQFGYSRDHRGDRPQLVIGLLCALDGRPVAVEVFEGNTGDPTTVPKQIETLKQRFNLKRVVLVGDRGMITDARIEATLRPAGLDWITALRAPAIQQLAVEGGPLQPSLFDTRDMAEITSPDFPGERLVVCKNPLLADERARKRGELLAATEKDLDRIQKRVQRAKNPLRGAAKSARRSARSSASARWPSTSRPISTITASASPATPRRSPSRRSSTASTCVRTSLAAEQADAATTVRSYKSLARVERAFRCMKTVDLELRPVFHWTAARVRAHVLLCMLAYYLEWHMRQKLAPLLFDDHDRPAAEDTAHVSGGQGRAVASRTPQGRQQTDRAAGRCGAAGAQLPHSAGRSGHADAQCDLLWRGETQHRDDHTHRTATQSA